MTTPDINQSAQTEQALCACGHLRSSHADPATGDSRCLVVEDRRDLLDVFDDGRDSASGYCGCLRFRA